MRFCYREARRSVADVIERGIGLTIAPSFQGERRKLVEGFGIDLVIDVGANVGQFYREIRSHYDGNILSYEPVDSLFRRLTEKSQRDLAWKIVNKALGSTEGKKTIRVFQDNSFSSFLDKNGFFEKRFGYAGEVVGEEMVDVATLADELEELTATWMTPRRIFLKMDTQGWDLEVFSGLGRMEKAVVGLQTELSLMPIYDGMPHWTEAVATYEKAGFRVVAMEPITRYKGAVVEYDCLMKRLDA